MATAKKTVTPAPPASALKAPAARAPAAKKAAAPRPAAKPASKAAAPKSAASKPIPAAPKAAPGTKAAKPVKPEKPKKPKLVRDSFTIPKAEYLVLEALKQRGAKLGVAAKKSELLRAGIKALAAMSDVAFLASLAAVPAIKTGRPKAG